MDANSNLREVTIEATVIRADGTHEELGVVSSWHKNPLIRAVRRLKGHGTTTATRENPDGNVRR